MTQPLSKTVAGEVRAEMARRGLMLRHIAEWLGKSETAAGQRVSGAIPFRLDEVQTIADRLGIPLAQLIGEQNGNAA